MGVFPPSATANLKQSNRIHAVFLKGSTKTCAWSLWRTNTSAKSKLLASTGRWEVKMRWKVENMCMCWPCEGCFEEIVNVLPSVCIFRVRSCCFLTPCRASWKRRYEDWRRTGTVLTLPQVITNHHQNSCTLYTFILNWGKMQKSNKLYFRKYFYLLMDTSVWYAVRV